MWGSCRPITSPSDGGFDFGRLWRRVHDAKGVDNEAPKEPSSERQRRENGGAEGAEWGGVWGNETK